MEGLIGTILSLGMAPMIVWLVLSHRYRLKQLEIKERQEARGQLESGKETRAELEARVQNLESIVCSVDFELNQRLNRLAAEQSAVQRLPRVTVDGTTAGRPAGLPAPVPGGDALSAPVRGGTLATPHASPGLETFEPGYRLGQLVPGQVVLGRYTVEREIGRGGMGAVYLAKDAKLDERVALKTISPAMSGDPDEMIERFRMEVQAARKVTHPNVIRIHDLGEDGSLLFLSMEYIEGETLWRRVKRLGPLPVAEAVKILGQVGAGVAAAHAAGVIHRDLKPQNVLIGSSGERVVKVIDFGLAKASMSAGTTATGIILGTPEYMAPEQIRGQRSDARTDVYALGALAYYVLCGRPPFVGETPIAVGFAQVHETPDKPRTLRPEIPAALEAVIVRSLAKDPAARYLDAAEWRTAVGG